MLHVAGSPAITNGCQGSTSPTATQKWVEGQAVDHGSPPPGSWSSGLTTAVKPAGVAASAERTPNAANPSTTSPVSSAARGLSCIEALLGRLLQLPRLELLRATVVRDRDAPSVTELTLPDGSWDGVEFQRHVCAGRAEAVRGARGRVTVTRPRQRGRRRRGARRRRC